jgi:hypothetical protein
MSGDVALMIVHTADFDIGIDAARIHEVIPLERWSGEAAFDLLERVGSSGVEGAARILVVRRDTAAPLAALVSGSVTLRHVARRELLAVPAPLAAHVRWLSHVVVTDGQRPLLVVDAERIAS